jgi:hypothetical protein
MNDVLVHAIGDKYLVEFVSKAGGTPIVEPHDCGIRRDAECLLGVQLGGDSHSGASHGWMERAQRRYRSASNRSPSPGEEHARNLPTSPAARGPSRCRSFVLRPGLSGAAVLASIRLRNAGQVRRPFELTHVDTRPIIFTKRSKVCISWAFMVRGWQTYRPKRAGHGPSRSQIRERHDATMYTL